MNTKRQNNLISNDNDKVGCMPSNEPSDNNDLNEFPKIQELFNESSFKGDKIYSTFI